MFIPSTFKRPVSSWKALNLRKTLLMASSVRLKPLNCSRLPCVYAQEIGRAVQQECRDRSRMPSSARKKKILYRPSISAYLHHRRCSVLDHMDIGNRSIPDDRALYRL